MNYYNENDPGAAAWLRSLIERGCIPPGVVDTRSITEVKPDELRIYAQCHFFAGIGGWSYALQLAGWPESSPVWTGSCPCQPFSVAGRGLGEQDERHLWPVFRELIAECSPPVVFGEQVASSDGRDWLAGVRLDLEALGYAVGAADLCAAGIGAPHIRQRLYWVGDSIHPRLEGHPGDVAKRRQPGRVHACEIGPATETSGDSWNYYAPVRCADGKTRRIEPGLATLAHGIPARVVRLRGYGNAIVPQLAAQFIASMIDCYSVTARNSL